MDRQIETAMHDTEVDTYGPSGPNGCATGADGREIEPDVAPAGPRNVDAPTYAVPVLLSEYRIACLLCSAWEGGSNYWARSEGAPYREIRQEGKPRRLGLSLPVDVIDLEASFGSHPIFTLDAAAIDRGLAALATKAPRHLAAILTDDADAETGDVFLQLCLFGEIRYS
jgi:hypothetical protein